VQAVELTTARLQLSGWAPSDAPELAAICADPEVMRYFPAPLTRARSDELLERLKAGFERRGYDFWAVREVDSPALLGLVGLTSVPVSMPVDAPVEVGWRLARSAWGRGIATEAASASLDYGFDELGLTEIVAYTSQINERSRRVMSRLGMQRDAADDFDNPSIAAADPLRPHVVYRTGADAWRARRGR
jgi:RimJ/RimL family protein N-acetyltransferase